MESKDKINAFNTEINYIKNNKYKEYLYNIIPLIPDYFFSIAASSTGKYHPAFSLGEGGLLRHTKAAVRIAYELFQDESICKFTNDEMDMIIISIILHDTKKHGENPDLNSKTNNYKFEHPVLAANFVKENKFNLTDEEINFISSNINSHMGPWNTVWSSNVVLDKPKKAAERFVHMCDYLSSRKFLDVKFENNEIVM